MPLFKKISRWLMYLALAVLLLILISALAIRFVVYPNIDRYKTDIATYASQTLGQKVAIGEIVTGWSGFSPKVVLKNIDILDAENRSALHLNQTEATLSWLSVPLLQPRLAKLKITGPDLTVRRQADGSIYLAGINMAGKSNPTFANWLISQSNLTIKNATVTWQDDLRKAPPLALTQLNFSLNNATWRSLLGKHQWTLTAQPNVGTALPIAANGYFIGNDIAQINRWHGEVNAEFKQADLNVWRPWFDYPINIQTGTGDAKVLLEFANAKIEKASAVAAINQLSVLFKTQTIPLQAKQFSGEITWTDLNNIQTIRANKVQLASNTDFNIKDGNGFFSSGIKNKQPWVQSNIALQQFNLSALKQLAVYVKLPETTAKQLNILAPTGLLNNLKLSFEGNVQQLKTYKIDTEFKDLSLLASQKIPGFTSLTGKIVANQNNGELQLNTRNAILDFKGILRKPIPADQLTGKVTWTIDQKKSPLTATISTQNLHFANAHIAGNLNANYNLNQLNGGYLDLTAKFDKGNAKFAHFYYPTILGETTLHWLDTSILAGKAQDVNVVVKGNLADFPFVDKKNQPDKKLGLFKVTAKITDAVLEYGTGWPLVESLNMDMLFEGKRMELNATSGRVFGNKITKSKTVIQQLDAQSPVLNIVSELEGPVTEGLKFVNQSPVKEVTLGFTEQLKAAGDGKLSLVLNIPMQDLDAAQYKGVYSVSNGTLFANPDIGLPTIAKLNGKLMFTENNLTTQNISAEILGGPAQFTIKTGANKVIRIAATGRATDTEIKKLAPNAFTAALKGSADWQADIAINKPLVEMSVRSNLVGMAIQLPAPFNKPANQEVALTIDKKQTEATKDSIDLAYGKRISAKLLRQEKSGQFVLDRGDVGINTPAITPTQDGLSLHGTLDYVRVEDWVSLGDQLFTDAKSANTNSAPTIVMNKANVSIAKLDAFGVLINALKVSAQPVSTGLQLAVESEEVTGNIDWQKNDNGKIIARLKDLSLPKSFSSDSKKALQKDFKKQLQQYPALDITADNVSLGQKKIGALTLNAFENGEDWVIEKCQITNPDSTLDIKGNWHNWVRNPNTNLVVAFNTNDIGKTLNRFGQPGAVKDGTASLSGALQWPGSPLEYDARSLSGHLKLDVTKGQFLKVQPGVGRLLGLLSLQSLPRRLTLNFNDLFSDGFAFDSITATSTINKGIMQSRDFFMTGPAAEAKIKGEVNLASETQHLKVKVTPHISDTLSLAALAGGPIVGAAAFVAQKILRDPFNKIASTEYEITGTWDNPQEVKPSKESSNKPSSDSPLTP